MQIRVLVRLFQRCKTENRAERRLWMQDQQKRDDIAVKPIMLTKPPTGNEPQPYDADHTPIQAARGKNHPLERGTMNGSILSCDPTV